MSRRDTGFPDEVYLEFTSLKTALTCGFTVVDIAATESLSSIVLEGRLS